MAVHDALDRGQADARARKLRGFVQALKGPEQLVRIGQVKPGAVIPDKENGLSFLGIRPNSINPPERLPVNFQALSSRFEKSNLQ